MTHKKDNKRYLLRKKLLAISIATIMLSAATGNELMAEEETRAATEESTAATEAATDNVQTSTEQTPSETVPENKTETPEEEKTPDQENENISEPEKSPESESENVQISEREKETESDTEKITESSSDPTSETESETDSEAESKNEKEDETEAKARIETNVKQEVFLDADQMLSIKYTVSVVNRSDNAKAEGVTVKAILGSELSFFSSEGQSSGLNYVENLGQIPACLDLKEISNLNREQLKDYGSAVIWVNETISEGEKKEFVFFAHVGDMVTRIENLPTIFFSNGQQVEKTRIQWINGELLTQQKESEAVTELPAEYPIQASWIGDTLGIGDTVTLTALTEEENAPVFWEACGEDGIWNVVSEEETYSYELTMNNYEMSFRAVSRSTDETSAGE